MNPAHHRKRSFSQGKAHHFVFKAHTQAFFGNHAKALVDRLLKGYGKYFGVKIYHRGYVGNHLHIILLAPNEKTLAGFLRVLTGQIALRLNKSNTAFWKCRPWSRIIQWGRDYGIATKYVALNVLEGMNRVIRSKNTTKELSSELKLYQKSIEEVLAQGLTQL